MSGKSTLYSVGSLTDPLTKGGFRAGTFRTIHSPLLLSNAWLILALTVAVTWGTHALAALHGHPSLLAEGCPNIPVLLSAQSLLRFMGARPHSPAATVDISRGLVADGTDVDCGGRSLQLYRWGSGKRHLVGSTFLGFCEGTVRSPMKPFLALSSNGGP